MFESVGFNEAFSYFHQLQKGIALIVQIVIKSWNFCGEGLEELARLRHLSHYLKLLFFKLDSFTKITRTLPLEPKGSVEWCWPGHELIMHFTKLPQAFSTSIVPFFFCLFCILYKSNSQAFYFFNKKVKFDQLKARSTTENRRRCVASSCWLMGVFDK